VAAGLTSRWASSLELGNPMSDRPSSEKPSAKELTPIGASAFASLLVKLKKL